jgi:hypothetical protein
MQVLPSEEGNLMAARPKAKAKKPIPGSARWDRALRAIGELCVELSGLSRDLSDVQQRLLRLEKRATRRGRPPGSAPAGEKALEAAE